LRKGEASSKFIKAHFKTQHIERKDKKNLQFYERKLKTVCFHSCNLICKHYKRGLQFDPLSHLVASQRHQVVKTYGKRLTKIRKIKSKLDTSCG